MNYIKAVCPHCKKEIQLPEDAENIVCMYCAQPIDVQALLAEKEKTGSDYKRLMDEAVALLNDDIFENKEEYKSIKQKNYPEVFQSYNRLISPALRAYSLAATESDDAADYFAGILFDRFQKRLEAEGIKKKNDIRLFDCRYMIVAFTVPAMLEQHTPAASELADSFLSKWNAYYPKNPLGKSTYDVINNGFRKKLCFITTAACTALGKGDHCAELEAFREFRDNWFSKTAEGKAKIGEYYLFAPMIVRAIDQTVDEKTVYNEIWSNYLSPCLASLKQGNPQKCANQYEKMMTELEYKWLSERIRPRL